MAAIAVAIPIPYTQEASQQSAQFRSAASSHLETLRRAIDELVTWRAAGIPERMHAMSLRIDDFFDLERLIYANILQGIQINDVSAWNYAVDLQGRQDDYNARAEQEIISVCNFLSGA